MFIVISPQGSTGSTPAAVNPALAESRSKAKPRAEGSGFVVASSISRNRAVAGQAFFFAGKYDESIERLQKTIELEPNLWLSHLFLARVFIEKQMYAEAIAAATKATDLSGGNSEAIAHVVYALAKSGKQKEARTKLDELKKRANERYVPPYAFALSYNGLGETDEAIAWLVKGLEQRDINMTLLVVDPKWNNLRGDSRFQDLLRRAGFHS